MSAEYAGHRARLHARAVDAHRDWLASLTEDQKANLAALGVLDPPDDSSEVSGHNPFQLRDAAESSSCRVEEDMASHIDGEAEITADEFGIPLALARRIVAWKNASLREAMATHEADLLGVVVGGLLSSRNIPIAAAGLAFAANLAATSGLGCPAAYAKRLGVSRSIISKAVKFWRRQLNLRTTPWQKSDEACTTYSQIGRTNHWRTQKTSALRLAKRLERLKQRKPPRPQP